MRFSQKINQFELLVLDNFVIKFGKLVLRYRSVIPCTKREEIANIRPLFMNGQDGNFEAILKTIKENEKN